MDNQRHSENTTKTIFQDQRFWFTIIDTDFFWFSRWLWLPIGSGILFLFVGFLNGFGYPLVLKSCFFCFLFVFSMVLATNWFWNFGFLGFIFGFWLPIGPFWLTCACWRCCFAIAKQCINLKTCIWPRRKACFEKWCFPTVTQHSFWNGASHLGETHFFNIEYVKNIGTTECLSHIYIYIYIYVFNDNIIIVIIIIIVMVYIHICICMYMYVYVCICVYMYMYVCMYVCVFICIYIYIYIHAHSVTVYSHEWARRPNIRTCHRTYY